MTLHTSVWGGCMCFVCYREQVGVYIALCIIFLCVSQSLYLSVVYTGCVCA